MALFYALRMKTTTLLLSLILGLSYLQAQKPGDKPSPLFSEEFSGNKIDESLWGLPNAPWFDVFYRLQDMAFGGGMLRVEPKYYPGGYMQNGKTYLITSGGLISKRSFRYGYFEMRCKFPDNPSLRSALWLQAGTKETYREIDIFEFDGDEVTEVPVNLHYADSTKSLGRAQYEGGAFIYDSGVTLTADYHLYGMEWTEHKIAFYFDYKRIRECDISAPLFFSLREEMKLYITHHKLGNPAPYADRYKNSWDIDYIRVWESRDDRLK